VAVAITAERALQTIARAIVARAWTWRSRNVGRNASSWRTDARVKGLNGQFRGKDAPTNVLSFPSADKDTDEPETHTYLGDVILAEETIRVKRMPQSKSVTEHTIHLIVHGILHLLGYDHESRRSPLTEMEALEVLNPWST
jgi:rRNA maturation RNase YbeY